MSMIQINYTGTATAAAAAMVDIQEDGVIEGISWSVGINIATTGHVLHELSFGSTAAHTTNDARQVIDTFCIGGGVTAHSDTKYTPMNLPVFGGERIYLHQLLVNAAVNAQNLNVVLHIKDKTGRTSRVRR